jgi:predicted hydrocarbon binding protein
MPNVFARKKAHNVFSWDALGDIKEGRGDLGEEMPVLVYRLMQYTMLDVLSREYGSEKANEYFREAGYIAGQAFADNLLDLNVDLNVFVANLHAALKDLKIGILRLESHNTDSGAMILTVAQDLDCSGLPVTNETVCFYDEGFIAGILNRYTGMKYVVKEIDCWANGDRVCRFDAHPVEKKQVVMTPVAAQKS